MVYIEKSGRNWTIEDSWLKGFSLLRFNFISKIVG